MPTFLDKFDNSEELILRDHLALQRTNLANERTCFRISVRLCICLPVVLVFCRWIV